MESYGRKKPTINQVAYRAGVSVTTVSLYLAGNTKVCSPDTAKRIELAVEELGYQPNPLAGNSFNKSRRTIGLLASSDLERGNNPWAVYNMKILSGIFEVANESNYAILAYPFRVYLAQQYRAVLDGRVDGILFYGSCNHEIVRQLTEAKMPVVCFGIPEEPRNAAGLVYSDEVKISEWALQHLWDQGHRRIAHLGGPFEDCFRYLPNEDGTLNRVPEPAEQVSAVRRKGAMDYLIAKGAYDPALFSGPHAWHDPDVEPAMGSFWEMKNRPTAIYCANDYIAWKAIEWARQKGVRIPEDLAFVGVDNVESPSQEAFLSSVQPRIEDIGRQSMHLILEGLTEGVVMGTVRVIEPAALIVRRSTSLDAPPAQVIRPG